MFAPFIWIVLEEFSTRIYSFFLWHTIKRSLRKKKKILPAKEEKKKNTGEENKTNQLPVLRTFYKTDDIFSGCITTKSGTIKETCTEC